MGDYTVTERRAAHGGERRDPRGGTASVGWYTPGQPRLPKWGSQVAFDEGYLGTALVNRAINIIADRIAQLPFRAGADPDNPDDFNKNAPLAKLLGPPPGKPNPEFSSRDLWRWAIKNYITTGRFAWEIEEGSGGEGIGSVVGLWPLMTGAFQVVPSNGGRRYFDGFLYNPTGDFDPTPFKREEVVYGWNKSPDDPREPFSPLQAIRWNVTVIAQIDKYNFAFVKNDAKPATIVVHAPFESPEKRDAWRRGFSSEVAGPLNANKTMFNEVDPDDKGSVEGMLGIKQIGATARDSQLAEIYEQQLDAVTTGLGVPMSLMDSSDRTFSNADQEMQNFYELTILPYCSDLADIVNRDLSERLGSEVGWFDLSKVDALKPRLSPGWTASDVSKDMTTNERRSFAGLGPADMAELDAEKKHNIELAQAAAEPIADAGKPEETDPEKLDSDDGPPKGSDDNKVVPINKAKSRLDEIEQRLGLARGIATARLEALATRILADLNDRSLRSTVTRAEGKRGRQAETPADLYDRRFWHDEAQRSLIPLYEAAQTVAEATLAGMVPRGSGSTTWATRSASNTAHDVVAARHAALLTCGDDVRTAFSDALLGTSPQELAETAYDAAVADLSGVDRARVTELVVRLAAGEVDLATAMEELTGE